MTVVCITQARMTSTRLPGKVMLPVLGRSLLAWHLDRLNHARRVDVVAVATVDSPESAPIAAVANQLGNPVTFGPEDDVLARYVACARTHDAHVVVRVTSDCPLIDPVLVDACIDRFLELGVDYLNLDITSFPRGFDCEVFTRAALEEAAALACDPAEHEHVTPYIYRHPEKFRMAQLGGGEGAEYRLCVDQALDFKLVSHILTALADKDIFGWRDVVDFLRANPEWADINHDVHQKVC
ncbi:MAG: glycosyltransferase family protein [Rhodospirillaceae bacterium]|nr:glycosyltransferase family protein [Rhodospirillales bacterium]